MGIEHATPETADQVDTARPAPLSATGPSAPVPLPVVSGGAGGEASPVGGNQIGHLRRYTVEGALKVSANRSLAVGGGSESKDFFALPPLVERSKRILKGMDSQVTLTTTDDAPPALDNLKKVVPKNVTPAKSLFDRNECIDVASQVTNEGQSHAVFESAQDNGSQKSAPLNPRTLSSVNKMVEAFTGNAAVGPPDLAGVLQELDDKANADDDHDFDFKVGADLHVKTSKASAASTSLKQQLPDKNLRVALFREVIGESYAGNATVQQAIVDSLPEFKEKHPVEPDEAEVAAKVADWAGKITKWIHETVQPRISAKESASRKAVSTAYAALDPQVRAGRAASVGVNEFARPEIGESYGTLGTRDPVKGQDDDKWTYHFAAVVARDGDDSVTLENYNRRGQPDGDEKWYFDMQGKEKQSFHEKHAGTVPDGMTVRMGRAATEGMRGEFIQRAEEVIGPELPAELRERMMTARTQAELASIYADATEGH